MIDYTTKVKYDDCYATMTIVLQRGYGCITTIKTVETRDKNKNDRDVGMKKHKNKMSFRMEQYLELYTHSTFHIVYTFQTF